MLRAIRFGTPSHDKAFTSSRLLQASFYMFCVLALFGGDQYDLTIRGTIG